MSDAKSNPTCIVFPRPGAQVKIRRPNLPLHRTWGLQAEKFLTGEERRAIAAGSGC